MPGIVVFNRRWSVGSDDLVIPASALAVIHGVWIIVLGTILAVVPFDGVHIDGLVSDNVSSSTNHYADIVAAASTTTSKAMRAADFNVTYAGNDDAGTLTPAIVEKEQSYGCGVALREGLIGFLATLCLAALLEAIAACVSMRGSILNADPRAPMRYLLYFRLGVFVVEVVWQIIGIVWMVRYYRTCGAIVAKRSVLGVLICNWLVTASILLSIWCTFDAAGRSWVKMKRYQESLKGREGRGPAGMPGQLHQKRCSGNSRRNWRHRKAMRKYEQSWDRRCRFLFCCVKEDRHRNSFTEIAKLFTEFFRDLDVVPSDVVAGLVLLRQHQQRHRKFIVSQSTNEVYEFLSGVPITPQTEFVDLSVPSTLDDFNRIVHFMRYALAAYGWPIYMMMNTGSGLCKIMPKLRCCGGCCCDRSKSSTYRSWTSLVVDDNCCSCNFAALRQLTGLRQLDVVYATYHVDIGETPFYIAIDHEKKAIVISIRGTLSLQDVLTDLKADAEILPVEPMKEDWLAHKGMVQAASYIRKKIKDELLLNAALNSEPDRGSRDYDIVVVGHSLGAGTAAILAILLRQDYPRLQCYAFSPPGGLLSAKCVEETKSFITSVIVGKDVVPRIGLHQLEAFRQDIINVIKRSTEPKWKIITGSFMCCRCRPDDNFADVGSPSTGRRASAVGTGYSSSSTAAVVEMSELMRHDKESRTYLHPGDAQISLSAHTPLYLPGTIYHVVRTHPVPNGRLCCGAEEPVYMAIKADKEDFNEVLISPTMVNDHMPDKVLEGLEKVLSHVSRSKSFITRSRDDAVATGGQQRVVVACFDGQQQQSTALDSENGQNDVVIGLPSNRRSSRTGSQPDHGPFSPLLTDQLTGTGNGTATGGTVSSSDDQAALMFNFGSQSTIPCRGAGDVTGSTATSPSACDAVSMSATGTRYPQLKARLPTPQQQLPLNSTTAEAVTEYRYSVDPPSPVAYPGDSPDREITPIVDAREGSFPGDRTQPDRDPVDGAARGEMVDLTSTRLNDDDVIAGRCSPESVDSSYGCQYLYDPYIGHYSPAGRGYPHGMHPEGFCSHCCGHDAASQPAKQPGTAGQEPVLEFSNGFSSVSAVVGDGWSSDCANVQHSVITDNVGSDCNSVRSYPNPNPQLPKSHDQFRSANGASEKELISFG